ncbi:CDP-glucose 4,6-dehydratase [Methylobacterium indicum]|uniref:CDP-glucose 4,6-dehydratase n=1 Tax=Methylobacterium indicum TaxID=1775910 RepID=A0ABR5H8G1_9HYPH|nr:CDP-glucose 4,6-dehydratase [Methylobacterium indicum]KMO19933.1 CDP-glucose 4,6-dehydratase [Methylobacterium indicum]KMO20910.1 CDP-glucose 4,6-dehydratase [Methylobacterium indicum]
MQFFEGIYRDRRILVTGHTGFKGSWLTAWLASLGADVCGYSDRVPTTPSLHEALGHRESMRNEVGDIRDRARLSQVINTFKPDFIFHLAAQAIVSTSYAQPLETIGVNVLGTATVLDILRETEHPCTCIVITSDKAYDNVEWLWGYRETDRLGGKDVYSGSKGAAELVFNSYYHSFFNRPQMPVRLASARAGNVIGGGDWAQDRIVADCIRAWSKGDHVSIRSPRATRPWQHVLEPLSGYLNLGARLSLDPTLNGESFNFGPKGEQNATVLALLAELASVWGFENPADAYRVVNDIPFHEASLLKLNIDKALGILRWQPTLSYDECVGMTGSWYREVVKNGADARTVTSDHIDRYQHLARQRQHAWTV